MTSTIEATRAPLVIRMLNKAGAALEAVGLRLKPLAAAQLIHLAPIVLNPRAIAQRGLILNRHHGDLARICAGRIGANTQNH